MTRKEFINELIKIEKAFSTKYSNFVYTTEFYRKLNPLFGFPIDDGTWRGVDELCLYKRELEDMPIYFHIHIFHNHCEPSFKYVLYKNDIHGKYTYLIPNSKMEKIIEILKAQMKEWDKQIENN